MSVSIFTDSSLRTLWQDVKSWNEKKSFKRKHQLSFLNNMVMLTKSGMALDVALRALSKLGAARKIERKVADDIAGRVRNGDELHLAMVDWFDPDIAAAFSVSQHHSGAQENITSSLIERNNWLGSLIESTLKSNAYLAFISVLAFAAMLFFGLSVLPDLSQRLGSGEVPFIASLVMTLSGFLANYGLVLLIAGVAGSVLLANRLSQSDSAFRLNVLDFVWPFSIYKQVAAFKHFSQLLKMVEWGDTPLQAAEKINAYSSPYIKHYMGLISERASDGIRDISQLFDVGFLSPATQMQIELASKAETNTVIREVLNQVPVLMRVETQSMMNKLKHSLTVGFLVFIVGVFLTLFFAFLSVYSQIISTTNIGY